MNKKLNVGVIIDITPESGGKLHMAISMCKYLKQIKEYNFVYITTFKGSKKILNKKLGIKTLLFNKIELKVKILNRLKNLFSFLPIQYSFEKFLIRNNINSVFFLDPSPLINNFKNINFIYTIFDLEHRKLLSLPEFDNKTSLKRDKDYTIACNNCSKLVVGTKKIKAEVSKIYNISKNKIYELRFPPPITSLSKKANTKKIVISGDYLLYPAQFWAHKNHIYIVNAINYLKKIKKLDFKVVFTGYDKGNLYKIKILIKKFNLQKKFLIFNYVDDHTLRDLYKNCLAVIIPTMVAPHTFPLYEAFFFRKPVIYNTKVLDPELKDKVIKLNINKTGDIKSIMQKVRDKKFVKKIVKKNYDYYTDTFNKNKIITNLKKVLKNQTQCESVKKIDNE